jgi:hypothetical protein
MLKVKHITTNAFEDAETNKLFCKQGALIGY